MVELTPSDWLLLCLGAFMVGLGKGGLPGAGNVSIWLFAEVLGAKASVGYLLLVLVCADLVAITVYRRHAQWGHLRQLLPPTILGVFIGWMIFDYIPAVEFQKLIGAVLLLMTGLHFLREWVIRHQSGGDDPVLHSRWFVLTTGISGGLATMLANAAGPIAAFYLMAVRLPKYAFIGTIAWMFFVINVIKIPLQASLGNIHYDTLTVSLTLGAVAALGACLAPRIVHYIPQKLFSAAIWSLIVFAGITMLL